MRVVVSGVARPQRSMRFRGRSYMAFVLTPEPPIADWLSELDDWIRSSTGYFVGRPVVLDLSSVALSGGGIAHLVSELSARDIRVMGMLPLERYCAKLTIVNRPIFDFPSGVST